jgi:2-C-methyl-D-erythritol 2,4-cyclodiphosphate synthase
MSLAPEMRAVIARILEIGVNDISIKATTTERLGFIGREEGIMAQAVVLLKKAD